uniref:glutathione transferase n=1 Tax=Acrobeloides nanus TaxID=290746 RepID=A0A914CVG2_9BILA
MDFRRSVFPYLLAKNGFKTYQDFLNGKISNDLDEMREKLYNELWIPNSQHALPILEKLLKEAGTGFFGKDGVTWVDFNVVEYINTLEGMDPETLNKYPELINFKQRVYELPQIKNYVETRKISPV